MQYHNQSLSNMSINFCVNDCESVGMRKSGFNKTCSREYSFMAFSLEKYKPYIIAFALILLIIFAAILLICIFMCKARIFSKSHLNVSVTRKASNSSNLVEYDVYFDGFYFSLIKKRELKYFEEIGRSAHGIVYEGYFYPGGGKNEKIKMALKILTINKAFSEDIYESKKKAQMEARNETYYRYNLNKKIL